MTTVEKLKRMLDWIYTNTEVHNQTGVARKIGMNPVSMSKIHNGKTKSVKQETLRAINAAFGNVFNPEWLRGESDVMLLADVNKQFYKRLVRYIIYSIRLICIGGDFNGNCPVVI